MVDPHVKGGDSYTKEIDPNVKSMDIQSMRSLTSQALLKLNSQI